jgi:hypothetical protein
VRDLENVQKPEIEEAKAKQEVSLDWKKSLSIALCKSEKQLTNERTWAKFITRMRDLCPETTWFSIGECTESLDHKSIVAIQFWLESLVSNPEWPFPEQVILMTPNKNNKSFKVIFPKSISKLPYTQPPRGLSATKWKDKYSCGWKITQAETFNSTKAGEA